MGRFAQLVGNDAARKAMQGALVGNSLPGGFLITGAHGTGRAAIASALALASTCLQPDLSPFDSCDVCDSCTRALKGTQPEIVHIYPAGETIQIWQFWDRDNRPRGVLSHGLQFAPMVGRRRVFIIHNCEKLTESAANSLLKVLEEPPSYVLFILIAVHAARVLPTIASRCRQVRVLALPGSILTSYLTSNCGVSTEKAHMLVAYCEGRAGQAITLARNPQAIEEVESVLKFALELPSAKRVQALRMAEQMRRLASGMHIIIGEDAPEPSAVDESADTPKERAARRQQAAVLELLSMFYRDLLAVSVGGARARVVNRDSVVAITSLAANGTPARWSACIDSIMKATRRLEANASVGLLTDVLAMNLVDESLV